MAQFDWKKDVVRWTEEQRRISPVSSDEIVSFFEKAFDHTHRPEKAWFGIHESAVSLVVGGIYLAATQSSGQDRGLWLLVDQKHSSIDEVEYTTVKATQNSGKPLVWLHTFSFEPLPLLLDNELLWNSFSEASKLILNAPISADRDSVQNRRKKKRLSEFWVGKNVEKREEKFQNDVTSALHDGPEIRKRRLEQANVIPRKYEVVSQSFLRNPDVVAEVLYRANGCCEQCKSPAPFLRRSDKSPYLEVHHKKPLNDGGKDTVDNAEALCPNCHRRAHYG